MSQKASTGQIEFTQKKRHHYAFVFVFCKYNPIKPIIEISNEEGSQSTSIHDFYAPYDFNHLMIPKKLR